MQHKHRQCLLAPRTRCLQKRSFETSLIRGLRMMTWAIATWSTNGNHIHKVLASRPIHRAVDRVSQVRTVRGRLLPEAEGTRTTHLTLGLRTVLLASRATQTSCPESHRLVQRLGSHLQMHFLHVVVPDEPGKEMEQQAGHSRTSLTRSSVSSARTSCRASCLAPGCCCPSRCSEPRTGR